MEYAGFQLDHEIIDRIFDADFAVHGAAFSPNALTEHSTDFIGQSVEGRRALVLHMKIERSPSLIRHFKKGLPNLDCEVCDFNFEYTYGSLGRNYIEAHHTVPLAELTVARKTLVEELAAVCPNCHRMLHQTTPPITVEELRELLLEKRAARSDYPQK